MYKIVGMALIIIFSLFANLLHAQDNSQWCGTIVAIYGVCSPELIDNWLAHRNDIYSRPLSKLVAKPPGTESGIGNKSYSSPSTSTSIIQITPGAQKPCWYWSNEGWKKCRWIG